jgi:hypothetical protein
MEEENKGWNERRFFSLNLNPKDAMPETPDNPSTLPDLKTNPAAYPDPAAVLVEEKSEPAAASEPEKAGVTAPEPTEQGNA